MKSFGDGRLFGTLYGTGRPWLLALHGWRRTMGDFVGVLGAPGLPLDAIALDLPGFGTSPAPSVPWGSADYAAVVEAVLDCMQPNAVVMGHSFGGCVALNLAARHPERVSALVLSAVPLLRAEGRRPPARKVRLARRLRTAGLISERRLESVRVRHGSPDYRAAEGVMRQVLVRVLAEDYRDQLASLSCPVELVWGTDDPDTPPEVAERALSLVARGSLTLCPGSGHLVPLSAPGALRAAAEKHRA